MDIIQLTPELLTQADKFAARMIDSRNFTHFRHTSPSQMVNDRWEVYVVMVDNNIISWGQIENFLYNPNKKHVCRVGFAVLPEFQNQGYGGKMVDYVLSRCEVFSKIVATVYFDNKTMLTMFLQRGFVIEGFFVDEERYILNEVEGFDNKPRHVISLARRANSGTGS